MLQKLCQIILFKWLGWRVDGEPPEDEKYLFVAVPHTSNWDFVYGWLAIQALDLKVKIFAKDSFFIFPLNLLCKVLGVMPVNRRERTNFVDSVADLFEHHDSLHLLITPEGTRGFQPTLKSGYYYIAKKAKVPIVVAGPDFAEKCFKIMPSRPPLPSFEEDQANVIEFCYEQVAKHPEKSFQRDRAPSAEETK